MWDSKVSFHKPETKQTIKDMKLPFTEISDQKGWSLKEVGALLNWSQKLGEKFITLL